MNVSLRCNGRESCSVSLRDLRHQLLSDCPRMVKPTIRVRVSFQSKMQSCWKGKFFNSSPGSNVPKGCYGTKIIGNGQTEKNACLTDGGDVLFSANNASNLCSIINENADYAKDFNYWRSNRYTSKIDSLFSLRCLGSTMISSSRSVLCVYPARLVDITCKEKLPFPNLYPNFKFNESLPGVNQRPCPAPQVGTATWVCGSTGVWVGSPDLT